MTKTGAVAKSVPVICSGINAITPCSYPAEPGYEHCAEHGRMIDEFDAMYDSVPNRI